MVIHNETFTKIDKLYMWERHNVIGETDSKYKAEIDDLV
jgi:hypothetical protein